MADEPPKTGSWWATMPGILTATAAVITAASGFFAILAQNGVFGEKSKTLVSEKTAAVRDAVTAATPSGSQDAVVAKASNTAVPSAPATSPSATSPTVTSRESVASGISSAPLHAVAFNGAVVTLLDGSVVKLRDDAKEWMNGTALKTTAGQMIEMQRIRRFELADWKDGKGNAHITLNNGEIIDTRIEAYEMRGSNDLGDFRGSFDKIRSVEFVR